MKKFGLSKQERIKKRKEFEAVYSSGSSLISKSKKFKATYLIRSEGNSSGVKVAFAVSKKAGNAVWRNRVKRLMREAYRLNKNFLIEKAEKFNLFVLLVFSPFRFNKKTHRKIFLKDVETDIIELLKGVEKRLK